MNGVSFHTAESPTAAARIRSSVRACSFPIFRGPGSTGISSSTSFRLQQLLTPPPAGLRCVSLQGLKAPSAHNLQQHGHGLLRRGRISPQARHCSKPGQDGERNSSPSPQKVESSGGRLRMATFQPGSIPAHAIAASPAAVSRSERYIHCRFLPPRPCAPTLGGGSPSANHAHQRRREVISTGLRLYGPEYRSSHSAPNWSGLKHTTLYRLHVERLTGGECDDFACSGSFP